ncbi:MAG: hypothetical protein IKK52_01045 [Alphaproteobacteria bacterium]|nr:hypothetical protein [Alphaproteobacteria bacterium]
MRYNVVIGNQYGKKIVDFYPIKGMKDTLTHEGMAQIHSIENPQYYIFDTNKLQVSNKTSYGSEENSDVNKDTESLIKTSYERMKTHGQEHTFESISDYMAVSKWLYKSCCHTEWMQRE